MSCKPGVTRQGGVALLFAAVLLVVSGAFAGSAVAGPDKQPDQTLNDHPSGKDRNEEPGTSNVQGSSTSDPDGEANGGPDKPGGSGGFDADQDGNNGCGNDDDFEDDNNGRCRRAKASTGKGKGPKDPGNGNPGNGNPGNGNPGNGDPGNGNPGNGNPGLPGTGTELVDDSGLVGDLLLDPAYIGHGSHGSSHNSHGSHNSHAPLGNLPNTGLDSDVLTRLAVMLLGAGATVVLMSRRRTASTSV
jgi:hypothetical protein